MPAPVFISWSGLQKHEHCRQQHYLSARNKMGRPPGTDIRNFVHGTVADRVVRKWLAEETDHQPGQMATYVDEIFEVETTSKEAGGNADGIVKWRSVNDRQQLRNFVVEVVNNAEPYLFKYVIPYDWQEDVGIRTDVILPGLSGEPAVVTLVGFMDILVRRPPSADNPGFYGIDLKATTDDKYINKTLGQAIFYDVCVLSMFGEPAQQWAFLQPMTSTPWAVVNVTHDARRDMLARIHRMATYLWRKDISPKEDNTGCSSCEQKIGCEKFRPSFTPDGKMRLTFSRRTV